MTNNQLLVALANRLDSIAAIKDEMLDTISDLEYELNNLGNLIASLEDDLRGVREVLASGLRTDPPQHPHAKTKPEALCVSKHDLALYRFVKPDYLNSYGFFESLNRENYTVQDYSTMYLVNEETDE